MGFGDSEFPVLRSVLSGPFLNLPLINRPLVHVQMEANAMVVAGAEEYYRNMFFRWVTNCTSDVS